MVLGVSAQPPTGSTAGFISPDLSANGVSKSGFIVNVAAVGVPSRTTGS